MNTAQDILIYAESHEIQMSARDGKLVLEGRLTDDFLESAKQHKAELLKTLSQPDQRNPKNDNDAEFIKWAFRDGKSVRVWSGVLREWIWWSPDKARARTKKQETDEVVYHMAELITLIGRDGQSLKDMHILKKEFDGEITK